MIFRLDNEKDRKLFAQRSDQLIQTGATVSLTEKKKRRSGNQNRYFHLILGWFGAEFGYTKEEVKQIVKTELARDVFVYRKGNIEFYRSTSDLDKEQMAIVTERFRSWSNDQCGFYIDTPSDQFIEEMEYQLSRNNWINK